jgi:hypothetical protein
MKTLLLVPLAIGALVMAGCDNPKDVGKANFLKVINEHLKSKKLCVDPLKWVMVAGNAGNGYPVSVTMKVAELDLFVHAGLLTSTPAMVVPVLSTEAKPVAVKGTIFNLTEKGKQSDEGPPNHRFCYGVPEATKVLEYTEPGPDLLGRRMTQVTFEVGVKDFADWANDPVVNQRFKTVKPGTQGMAALFLTSEGWHTQQENIYFK